MAITVVETEAHCHGANRAAYLVVEANANEAYFTVGLRIECDGCKRPIEIDLSFDNPQAEGVADFLSKIGDDDKPKKRLPFMAGRFGP